MSRVEAIENQVKELSDDELALLRDWFADFDFTMWDLQIESEQSPGSWIV
jgi:hypothetical protein